MATLTTTPVNRSFLSNNKFDFILRRIPNFTYFVQAVNLPSLSLQSTTINTPFKFEWFQFYDDKIIFVLVVIISFIEIIFE